MMPHNNAVLKCCHSHYLGACIVLFVFGTCSWPPNTSFHLFAPIEPHIQAIGTALLDAQTLHLHAVLIHAQSYMPYEKSWMSVVDGGMYPWGK
jgi:hypothetical protein